MRLLLLAIAISVFLSIPAQGSPALLDVGGLLHGVAGLLNGGKQRPTPVQTADDRGQSPSLTPSINTDNADIAGSAQRQSSTALAIASDTHEASSKATQQELVDDSMPRSEVLKSNIFDSGFLSLKESKLPSQRVASIQMTTVVENESSAEDPKEQEATKDSEPSSDKMETIVQTQVVVLTAGTSTAVEALVAPTSYQPLVNSANRNVGPGLLHVLLHAAFVVAIHSLLVDS